MEENKKENVFKKLLKKEIIISLVVGLLSGIVIMFFVNGGFVARVGGSVITSKKLYNKMKDYYSIDMVLEDVDEKILDKKYKLSEDEINNLKETADGYIKQYAEYGYTQEQFLEENGFENYDALIDYLGLDYKRTLYAYDYLESKLEKDAVKNYYNEHAFGKVNTKHILAKISDDMTEEQALAVANEIISRLNAGESFDTLAEEYTKNYENKVITEDLGEIGAFDSIEEAYINAAKGLEAGKYTVEPVKTSYGYHVIYCVNKTEKTEEISNKDRMGILTTLLDEAEISLDQNTYYKALIQMRKEAKLKFFDKDLKTKYEEYCKKYESEKSEE